MTDTDTYKRDAPLVGARQELAQAASYVRSARTRLARDRRAKDVRLEAALAAIEDAEDDLCDALGVPHVSVRSTQQLLGEESA